jgi:hypothetical protein
MSLVGGNPCPLNKCTKVFLWKDNRLHLFQFHVSGPVLVSVLRRANIHVTFGSFLFFHPCFQKTSFHAKRFRSKCLPLRDACKTFETEAPNSGSLVSWLNSIMGSLSSQHQGNTLSIDVKCVKRLSITIPPSREKIREAEHRGLPQCSDLVHWARGDPR